MRNIFIFILLSGLLTVSFQNVEMSKNVCPSQADCEETPELNKKILAFAKGKLKKKVGDGECWTLASEALKSTGAKWDGLYTFGKEVNYKTECIFPGDIIQFEGIYLKYEKDGGKWEEDMSHHTAIVYEVKGPGMFSLIHQNNWLTGKKVGITDFNVKHITKGTFQIFRPVK